MQNHLQTKESIPAGLLSLAMAFVPTQEFDTPYDPVLAFSRGTIFPALDKEKLLGRVRMYDFALVEVIEYLDGHPDNAAALKYYNEMRTAFDKAAAEYEDAFGPLTAREVDTCSGHWTWIDDPWPWEGAED